MSNKYETFEALSNWQPSKQPKYDDTEVRTFLNNLGKDEDDIIDTTPKPAPKPKAKPKSKIIDSDDDSEVEIKKINPKKAVKTKMIDQSGESSDDDE